MDPEVTSAAVLCNREWWSIGSGVRMKFVLDVRTLKIKPAYISLTNNHNPVTKLPSVQLPQRER